ncbi:MAG TPA: hypothetical protein VH257_07235 [Chloroflexota bacterium]|nr:hypothetical protein [Chloroflexota bacterium]
MSNRSEISEDEQRVWPFLRFILQGLVTGAVFVWAGPHLLALVPQLGVTPGFSILARVALGFAGVMCFLTVAAARQVLRVPGERTLVLMKIPSAVVPWLAGLFPLAVGLLIGLAVFT